MKYALIQVKTEKNESSFLSYGVNLVHDVGLLGGSNLKRQELCMVAMRGKHALLKRE